jgi:hypothetical protein
VGTNNLLVCRLTTAAVAWFGLGLQLHIALPARMALGDSLVSALVWYLSFFTISTNLLVAGSLSVLVAAPQSCAGRWLVRASVQSAIAVYIILVAIAYELLLRRLWKPTGLQFVADLTLHDLTPLLYLAYWALCVPKGRLEWGHIPAWIVYPGIYLLYMLARGAATGLYPYPFLDAAALGYRRALLSALLLLLGLVSLAFVLVAVDRVRGRSALAEGAALGKGISQSNGKRARAAD